MDDLSPEARRIIRKLHQTIRKITDDFSGRWHFNTSVAALMEFLNECFAVESIFTAEASPGAFVRDILRNFVLMLAPFAPYLAHELWENLGETENLLKAAWPRFDPLLAKEEEIEIPVQINGKLRGRIVVAADAGEEVIRQRALQEEKVRAAVNGKQVVKVILVPGKLVNIVIR
jgi:leucyl-tRNA synthetase